MSERKHWYYWRDYVEHFYNRIEALEKKLDTFIEKLSGKAGEKSEILLNPKTLGEVDESDGVRFPKNGIGRQPTDSTPAKKDCTNCKWDVFPETKEAYEVCGKCNYNYKNWEPKEPTPEHLRERCKYWKCVDIATLSQGVYKCVNQDKVSRKQVIAALKEIVTRWENILEDVPEKCKTEIRGLIRKLKEGI